MRDLAQSPEYANGCNFIAVLERYQLLSTLRDIVTRDHFWRHVLYGVGRGRMRRLSNLNMEHNNTVSAILCTGRIGCDGDVDLVTGGPGKPRKLLR
jgi:hypothetical protein